MNAFARALEDNPAPSALGDVRLRYTPSMLIGEAPPGRRTWRPFGLATLGLTLVALAVASLSASWGLESSGALALGGAWALWGSVRVARLEVQRRAFVVNFATTSLRLDFAEPIAGQPRTLIVPFDAVTAVAVLEQADGAHCLTVDLTHEGAHLKEALVARVPTSQLDAAQRLARVLEGAFGLGSIPPTSPYLATQGAGRPSAAAETQPLVDAAPAPTDKPE
ncbi:MAG: hypothetical protein SFW67_18425 [Myxococcaceae bacterium]|nr:hypothetical protein [Myxococcaceae bacterium]